MTFEKFVQYVATPGAVAGAAFVAKVVIGRRKMRPVQFILDAFSAAVCGVIIWNVLGAWPELEPQVVAACSGLAGMLGPEILGGILTLLSMFRGNPSGFLMKHLMAIRGGKIDDETIEELRKWKDD